MKLIARKPCSFGGQRFFIGEEIPENLVADAKRQEMLGVIAAVPEAGGILETAASDGESPVPVTVYRDGGENLTILLTAEEVQAVFGIMQQTAETAVKEIGEVKNENVLILLHAADSRKTVREAAKKQADTLYTAEGETNAAQPGNESTDIPEGADM